MTSRRAVGAAKTRDDAARTEVSTAVKKFMMTKNVQLGRAVEVYYRESVDAQVRRINVNE